MLVAVANDEGLHTAGKLDSEVLKIDDYVDATATFIQNQVCLDNNGITKHLPLEIKALENISKASSID